METLTLIKDLGMEYPTEKSKYKTRYGIFKCSCGKEFKTSVQSVKQEKTKSCGCLQIKRAKESNTKHGLRSHRLYGLWHCMITRCNNKDSYNYKYYGERGIKVCDEWNNFENFINDMYPSYKNGLTLDRIDNDKNYCKDNCRWADKLTQSQNQRILRSTNKTGYKGVCFASREKKYLVTITNNNKQIRIGLFETALDGAKAYDKYVIDNKLKHTINGVL